METDMSFFEEVHLRETAAEKKVSRSNPFNFKTGLLAGALSVVAILLVVSFQSSSKESSFETLALHLDSIQIQQNARMIQLLEKNTKRDTTIVHIITPDFKAEQPE
jgi:hypothetical protein